MHDDILWQRYKKNGVAIANQGIDRQDFNNSVNVIVSNSHIWLWRRTYEKIEILLQKRSEAIVSWPGYYDISVAGHIDLGEIPVETAIRECREEIGIEIREDDLHFIFAAPTILNKKEIDNVYIFETKKEYQFSFDDGEVESLQWLDLNEFERWALAPEAHHLVPHGDAYFNLLLSSIRQYCDENH